MYEFNKSILILGVVGAVALSIESGSTTAAFGGITTSPMIALEQRNPIVHLQPDRPALAPFPHAMFCLRHPAECQTKRVAMRHGRIQLTEKRRAELIAVNSDVNFSIAPKSKSANVVLANWAIAPAEGDCNDYAITKRHELLARGWSSNSLLLAEVVTNWGEHHLVLVVTTRAGDFVLDNLAPKVRHWTDASYQWVRIQSPKDPKLWAAVSAPTT